MVNLVIVFQANSHRYQTTDSKRRKYLFRQEMTKIKCTLLTLAKDIEDRDR